MRKLCLLLLLAVLGSIVPVSASAKGFDRLVLIGSDHRSVEVRGTEAELSWADPDARRPVLDGYLRLFFVGRGEFPANPARYYPNTDCIALDWPRFETSCRPISRVLTRLLRHARALPQFRERPTVLAHISYLGGKRAFSGLLKGPGALKDPVELALDRGGRAASRPPDCFPFAGTWRGPQAAARPRRFLLCQKGVYAQGRMYSLSRGVWQWFDLNVTTR